MDLRALHLFVVVAEEGSIHAGARRLMITQPAVSQALRKLEREVGGAVLIRTPRGVQLTPAGVALLEHGRDILGRMDAATDAVRHIARTDNRVLRVGLMCGTASAGDLTFPIVAAFRRRYPDVRLCLAELTFDNQFDALVDGRVDVAIVRLPCDDDRLELVGLFHEPTVLCLSAEHRLAGADAVSLADVLDEPIVELVRSPRRWRAFWEFNELRGGPPRRIHPAPAVTLSELRYTLLCEPVVAGAAGTAWQFGLSYQVATGSPVRGISNCDYHPVRPRPHPGWRRASNPRVGFMVESAERVDVVELQHMGALPHALRLNPARSHYLGLNIGEVRPRERFAPVDGIDYAVCIPRPEQDMCPVHERSVGRHARRRHDRRLPGRGRHLPDPAVQPGRPVAGWAPSEGPGWSLGRPPGPRALVGPGQIQNPDLSEKSCP